MLRVHLSILLAALMGAAASLSSVPSVAPNQARIGGVGLQATETEVRKAFGVPLRVESFWDDAAKAPAKELQFEGVSVYLVNDEVYHLSCKDRRCRTPDGVHVGDLEAKVVATYGQTDRVSTGLGEVLRYNVLGSDSWLYFRVEGGRVVEIILWFDYV